VKRSQGCWLKLRQLRSLLLQQQLPVSIYKNHLIKQALALLLLQYQNPIVMK
jgi:hypothetical protein